MMFTFSTLKNEYLSTAATARLNSASEKDKLDRLAKHLLAGKEAFYRPVSEATGVPTLWLMVINERESSGRFDTYLGNGQPLSRITTQVPKGRGPWRTWADGAADAIVYDHVGAMGPEGWTLAWFLFRVESWNGFGPRLHGKRSGYLWAGSTAYAGGKYAEDGVWSPETWDSQPGCWALAKELLAADASLLAGLAPGFDIGGQIGEIGVSYPNRDHIPPDKHALDRVTLLQDGLNRVGGYGLTLDGSFGRHTRSALRKFQTLHGLIPDEIAGPLTWAALEAALEALPKEANILKTEDYPVRLINLIGDALGLDRPHSAASVAAGARNSSPGELSDALQAAADASSAPLTDRSGAFVDEWKSLGLHIVTGIGSVLVGSGLFDPAGPLSGMAQSHPLFGALLAILGPVANWWLVRSANNATRDVVDR